MKETLSTGNLTEKLMGLIDRTDKASNQPPYNIKKLLEKEKINSNINGLNGGYCLRY